MAYIRYVNNPSGAVYASIVDGEREGKTVKQNYLGILGVSSTAKKAFIRAANAAYSSTPLSPGIWNCPAGLSTPW